MSLSIESGTMKPTALRDRYLAARPFPHLVLDNFLEPAFLEGILREFPAFQPELAVSENGIAEGKMVHSDIGSLGTSFRALDELLRGPAFLELLARVTGIEGLFADPSYYGGGVHCSLSGQALDLHIDFNRHPAQSWRRRINVLLYLNQEWDAACGGALELHSNPRDPARDEAVSIAPTANRLVIFETNDSSWHGHGPIVKGPRRSIAAYYYTEVAEEICDPHSTVYVERALTGQESPEELAHALEKRRTHLARLMRKEREMLQTLGRMSRGAAMALEKLPADVGRITSLDFHITRAYERESKLQGMIDSLSDDIQALLFLGE